MPGVMTTRQRQRRQPVPPLLGSDRLRLRALRRGRPFPRHRVGAADQLGGVGAGPGQSDNALFSFTGEEDLVTGLATLPVANQCVAAYLSTFAFGTTEACIGSSQVVKLQAGTVGLAEAFVQLASEPHFTRRNTN
jgi:hypothetical protein